MTTRGDTIWGVVLLMMGPIVWATQFLLTYGLAGLVCARTAFPLTLEGFAVVSTIISIGAVVFLLGFTVFRYVRPSYLKEREGADWARSASIGLAFLAILAIIWGMAPLTLLPTCG